MKGRLLVFGMLATLISHSALADDAAAKRVRTLAQTYTAALGCDVMNVEPRNLVRVTGPKTNSDDNLEMYYVTVVNSDFQCAGGSGTSAGHVVVVGHAAYDVRWNSDGIHRPEDFRVRPELSEPAATVVGAPRAITSLYLKDGQLQATGLEYGDNDSNCCPSLKTIYKVSLVRKDVQVSKDDKRPVNTWVFTKIKNYQ
ncbi:exported hypothetical protein [Burkholderia sp. 8Y]|nr:exported hypothetical protein [Burkholderia sp. 8Y]